VARADASAAAGEAGGVSAFWSRILVAAVGLPLVLGLVYLGGWWLFALLAGGGLVALHELYAITRGLRPVTIAGFAGLLLILLGLQLGGLQWASGGVVATLALSLLLKGVAETRQSATVSVGTTVLGAAWIGFGLGYVLLVRGIPEHGRLAAYTLLLAVFAGDTAAYFVGMLVGRHKLAPTISPGKTWEGFIAGTAATILVTWIALYKQHFLTQGQSLVLGLAIALAGPVGDLFESALKRDMNVKDTGRILAGHGGVLDRVDSILFASAAAFYVILGYGAG
jgi:phosphatidate cytidylyltransferase